MREVTLQEENVAYEKAISNCEGKIQEKVQEADLLQKKLEVSNQDINNTSQSYHAYINLCIFLCDARNAAAFSPI